MSEPWATIYAEVWEDLVRYLDRKVWDPERARDLAQEAFVRALRADPVPEAPRAWLFTVAANLARDEARSALRWRGRLRLVDAEERDRREPPLPDSELEATERRRDVAAALDALSERDREVLLLWQAGLSYGEIAAASGLAEGAVGTTLSRARWRLVEAWTRIGASEETGGAPR
ncbi:MAG: sigma-70 family RNA polymerase sigma factor [Gemmatimonadota bacterium]